MTEGSPYESLSTSAALVLNSCAGMGLKINQKEEKTNMCKAILEIKQEGREEGVFKTLYELVRDNLLSLANAAKKAGQSETHPLTRTLEFSAGMSAYFAQGGA